jgi:prepilin-type N-terminal cleavage/methylation domain-containing protein
MMFTTKIQRGFTLVELLIGLLISLVVISGALALLLKVFEGQKTNLGLVRLNEEMRFLSEMMIKDIRRAGFVSIYADDEFDHLYNNPFFNVTSGSRTDITLFDASDYSSPVSVGSPGACLLFSYNADNDQPVVVDDNERMGYRLNGGVLQIRTEGTSNNSCNNGVWYDLSSPRITVTALSFTQVDDDFDVSTMMDGSGDDDSDEVCEVGEGCTSCASGNSCLLVRVINLSMTLELASDNSIQQTFTETVRIRNDKFIESYP